MKFIPKTLLILTVISAAGCSRSRYEIFSGYAQGGTYSVKANLKGVSVPRETVAAAIDSLLEEIDFSISGYNKSSLLSRRNAGEEIVPDRHFKALLELSDKYYEMTDGAFDVWSAPLFDIWGFGFTADSLPSLERIAAAKALCKEHKVVNFNAIAQGYTCDVVASYLYSIGVKDMLVDIGEIYCDIRKLPQVLHPGREEIRAYDRPEKRDAGAARPAERHDSGCERGGGGRPRYGVHGDGSGRRPRIRAFAPRDRGLPHHIRRDVGVRRILD